jgi:hypothetical protein
LQQGNQHFKWFIERIASDVLPGIIEQVIPQTLFNATPDVANPANKQVELPQ